MGMYDSVMVPCPECGQYAEFQSKSGMCLLDTYSLGDAPDDVLMDVNRHSPHKCEKCGTKYSVEINGYMPKKLRTVEAKSVVWKEPK